MNNTKGYKATGDFAIVHFGEDGKSRRPYYLKDGKIDNPIFTADPNNAWATDYLTAVERVYEQVKSVLEKKNHPLYSQIKIVEIGVREVAPRS